MTRRPRVLFVSHQATRTGAPAVLLSFLRWLAEHGDVDAEVLLWRDGPTEPDFRAVAPVHVAGRLDRGSRVELLERNLPVVGLDGVARRLARARLRPRLKDLRGYDLYWLNCAESAHCLDHLPDVDGLVVSHVHELAMAIAFALPDEDERRRWIGATDHFVAVADRVRDNLVDQEGVDPAIVSRHYEFVDADAVTAPPRTGAAELRRRLGVPAGAAVVGAAGTQEWRKGTDLFLQLARQLPSTADGPVHLVWVGGGPATVEIERLAHDLEAAGLADRVHFVGEQSDAVDWYRMFDVLVLTSREDPYPLVCLEAGLVGTPVVAFDNGGMVELLDGENGVVVPALDVEAMAAAVADLLGDPERRRRMGERLAADVRSRHDTAVAAPRLYELLRSLLEPGRAAP
ncbi:MAG: glycosyltransferase family 4 protein [Acidimicrobiales bacterium]|nr:glycosyltransferase family 4 protein [Acidimicrobiales bacterium]